ncbi:MAG: RDD family protein [Leptospirillia bacterium]
MNQVNARRAFAHTLEHLANPMEQNPLHGIPYRPPAGSHQGDHLPGGAVPAGYEVGPLPGGPGALRGAPADPGQAGTLPGTPAGFFRRAIAFFSDLVIAELLAGVLGTMAAAARALSEGGGPEAWNAAHDHAAAFAVQSLPLFLFTYLLFFTAYGGRTPGKMLFSLRAEKSDGTPLTWGRALGRTLGYLASFFTWGLGFLLALGPAKRALHDRLANTRVVYIPAPRRSTTPP